MDDSAFPSESKEHHKCWVRISEDVGDFMTFKVLTNDTLKVIHQLNIHSVHDPTTKNLHLDPLNEDFPDIVKSLRQQPGQDVYSHVLDHGETDAHTQNLHEENASPMNVSNTSTPSMAVVDPQDLVGHTFLMDECNDGQHFFAKIVECIRDHESDQVPFLEYEDLCNDVREAFPGLASLIDSIESALATMIAEDLKKDENDGNLLDLDSCTNCIHIPTFWMNALCLRSHFNFMTSRPLSTTGISIHDLFFGQCGDAVLALHRSMGSKAVLGWFAMSCPGWTSNCTDMTILPFDQGLPEDLTTFASSLKCLPFDRGPDQLSTSCQADNPILCRVTEAYSFCISDSVFLLCLFDDGSIFCSDVLANV